jgi:hypothetical protein
MASFVTQQHSGLVPLLFTGCLNLIDAYDGVPMAKFNGKSPITFSTSPIELTHWETLLRSKSHTSLEMIMSRFANLVLSRRKQQRCFVRRTTRQPVKLPHRFCRFFFIMSIGGEADLVRTSCLSSAMADDSACSTDAAIVTRAGPRRAKLDLKAPMPNAHGSHSKLGFSGSPLLQISQPQR